MAEPVAEQISVRLNAEQKAILDEHQARYPALSRAGLFVQLLYESHWLHEAGNNKSARLMRIEANSNVAIEMLQIVIDQLGGNADV